jgi:hypothetical protein
LLSLLYLQQYNLHQNCYYYPSAFFVGDKYLT